MGILTLLSHAPKIHEMSKWKRRAIVIFVGAAMICAPFLLMVNCSGWNAGSMRVQSCTLNFPFAEDLANFAYGLMLLASFGLGIPLLIYFGFVVLLSITLNRILRATMPSPPEEPKGVVPDSIVSPPSHHPTNYTES